MLLPLLSADPSTAIVLMRRFCVEFSVISGEVSSNPLFLRSEVILSPFTSHSMSNAIAVHVKCTVMFSYVQCSIHRFWQSENSCKIMSIPYFIELFRSFIIGHSLDCCALMDSSNHQLVTRWKVAFTKLVLRCITVEVRLRADSLVGHELGVRSCIRSLSWVECSLNSKVAQI